MKIKMKSIPAIVSNTKLTFIVEGKTYNIPLKSPQYNDTLRAVTEGREDDAILLANKVLRLQRETNGRITVENNGVVRYNGEIIHNTLTRKIVEFAAMSLPYAPMVKFLQNCVANPNPQALNELYPFLENRGMPITGDGCFLGYKVVKQYFDGHYYDKYTGTIINDVGTKVSREYKQGTDKWGEWECSENYFHVGNLDYAGPSGHFNRGTDDRVIIVKVNPKHVVSVTEEASKLITTAYEAISDFERVFDEPLVPMVELGKRPTAVLDKQAPWKDVVAVELLEIQPAKLSRIYEAVDKVRVTKHSHSKIRQVLAKIATKNKKGLWRLKRGH
jgi:hypothetical protein